MAKFHAGAKSKWPIEPFTIGREGPEFLPDPSGTTKARGTSPKTVQGSLNASEKKIQFSRKKKVPKKIT